MSWQSKPNSRSLGWTFLFTNYDISSISSVSVPVLFICPWHQEPLYPLLKVSLCEQSDTWQSFQPWNWNPTVINKCYKTFFCTSCRQCWETGLFCDGGQCLVCWTWCYNCVVALGVVLHHYTISLTLKCSFSILGLTRL